MRKKYIDFVTLLCNLEKIPAANVVEPRKAEWKWKGHGLLERGKNYDMFQCSSCGNIVSSYLYTNILDKPCAFCPFCGADMRGTP